MSDRDTLTTSFGLLANERRYMLVDRLEDAGTLELGTFADHVADHETDVDRQSGEWERTRKAAYVSLIQNHIPRLVDHGVIEYDEDAHVLMRGPRFDDVADVLDRARKAESRLGAVGRLFA